MLRRLTEAQVAVVAACFVLLAGFLLYAIPLLVFLARPTCTREGFRLAGNQLPVGLALPGALVSVVATAFVFAFALPARRAEQMRWIGAVSALGALALVVAGIAIGMATLGHEFCGST